MKKPYALCKSPMPYAKALCPITLCQSLLKNLCQICVKTATVMWGGATSLMPDVETMEMAGESLLNTSNYAAKF